jgi:hypothetical protein
MSQLKEAGKTWRGYFQGMPYPGGGLWAVGVTGNSQGNYGTLIEYHR